MKFIRFGQPGAEKPGILVQGQRRDCSALVSDWDQAFFSNHDQIIQELSVNSHRFPLIDESERWAAPIARPNMIMCVGLNYSDHAKESGMAIPTEPIIFSKATNTLAGPYDPVTIPKGSQKTDWEVELGLVMAKDVLYLENEQEAEAAIFGYSMVHDLSEREFQLEKGGQWVKGKSCPGFSPVGPWLLSKEEISNPLDLGMQLSVNGELVQDGHTGTMIFSPAYIVWYLSQYMKLEAGDLISTGTPPGVGLGFSPPRYLKAGDRVELSITGLGQQSQTFNAWKP